MAAKNASRWMAIIAYTSFTLGAVIVGIALIQMVSNIELLDNPWTGAVGLWLLAVVLYGSSKRSPSSAGESSMKEPGLS